MVNGVARWSNGQWNALGTGISGANREVAGLAWIGTRLYAAGSFDRAGGVLVNGVAAWDGTNWMALGSGLGFGSNSGRALTIVTGNNDLWLGGTFDLAGGYPSYSVARWNDQLDFQPRLLLSDPRRLPNGNFSFRLSANAVTEYQVEQSGDAVNWIPFLTNSSPSLDVEDSSLQPHRLFRARQR